MVKDAKKIIKGKNILITGGAGSIGGALALEVLKYKPKAIRILDIHEFSLFKFEQSLDKKTRDEKFRFILGDVRDADRIRRSAEGVNIIYHTAAYKHVPFCEYNPFEAVKVNVLGTQNVIDAAIHNNVERVVYISTDKAVNPTGTLGASKLLGEKIITAANFHKGRKFPVFSSVRFGNVIMSNGSVIPLFLDQIKKGGPVFVTSPEITRFFMPMNKAVELIVNATHLMQGGEIFVFKMKAVKIEDLANSLIDEYVKIRGLKNRPKVILTGMRAGEKIHESLFAEHESGNIIETKDMLVILPQLAPYQKLPRYKIGRPGKTNHKAHYSHKSLLSPEEIKKFIRENKIIN
ncbi:MAG: capsular polysaccharide biosynthesis protein D [Parcubacteria group bacterium Licking1014_17]|nr:MAG: capsular polysaccharide biosynthesis protein D [Parcubacteria group bacterium Licking1014_17]